MKLMRSICVLLLALIAGVATWNCSTPQPRATLHPADKDSRLIWISGNRLVTECTQKGIWACGTEYSLTFATLWSLDTFQALRTPTARDRQLEMLAHTSDRQQLAMWRHDTHDNLCIEIWDAQTGETKEQLAVTCLTDPPFATTSSKGLFYFDNNGNLCCGVSKSNGISV